MTVNAVEEYQRVENIRKQQERLIRREFIKYIQRATAPSMLELIEQSPSGDAHSTVLGLLDVYIEQFSNILSDVYIAAALAESDVWNVRLGIVEKAAFNVTRREVFNFLSTTRRNFIRNLTRQQRIAISDAIISGIQQNKTPKQIARMFADSIGLTPEQQRSVQTYRNALERGSRAALQRELRNPRFDERLSTAIAEGEALPQKQIDRMVSSYARNLKLHRANVIAQTESLRMVSEAREAAVRQAAETAGLDIREGTKTWNTTLDGRERDTHRALDGQTVPINDPFVSPSGARLMYPGDTSLGAGAAEIVNCRCSVTYSFEELG